MTAVQVDYDAMKARIRALWMTGDFGQIARYSEAAAEGLVSRCAITPGTKVLDVACGTGNTALPAARAGGVVTGVDIAPNLLEQARARAAAANLPIRFEEGDAEALSFGDGVFDLVISQFGAMFAPRPALVAAELLRVCRVGGRVVLGNWTPSGFIGELFRISARHLAPPPGAPAPLQWGDEAVVREWLKEGVADLRIVPVRATLAYPFSVAETVEFYRRFYGPTQRTFDAVPVEAQAALRRDLEAVWTKANRASDGTTRVEAEYLEITARRG